MSTSIHKYKKIDQIAVRITYVIALFILIGILIWGGVTLYKHWKYEYTNDAQIQEYINPILSRANGYVQEIRYKDHQKVTRGDTLVILETEETRVQKELALAAVRAAQAHLKALESNRHTVRSSSDIDKAKIDAAEAQLWQQREEYKRYQKLFEHQAVTQQRFEDIQTKLKVAEANLESMKRTYSTSKHRTDDVSAEIDVAQATIMEKEAALHKIELELEYATITAPTDGFMWKRNLQIGQLVQKGQTIGFIVDEHQGKWVVANFEETQIGRMQEGQVAEIKVDAYPHKTFHGVIESFSPATGSQFSLLPPDNATGNFVKITQRFPVRIQFTDDHSALKELRAGMNVEVSIPK